MTKLEEDAALVRKHMDDVLNGGPIPAQQTADANVKKLLQQMIDALRPNTEELAQRDRDLRTVIRLLVKYNLPFHYGAPPWPEGWP